MKVKITYTVPFHDTDALGIIWYGNYYKYFELVRNFLFEKIKFEISEWKNQKLMLVITESNCKYLKPLKYNDKIIISASVSESVYRLKLNYKIYKGKILVATGYTIQVPIKDDNYVILNKLPKKLIDKLKK